MYRQMIKLLCLLPIISACASDSTQVGDLRAGNERFASSQSATDVDSEAHRLGLVEGQSPEAVIVACSDSRVAPEIIFDVPLGTVFVIRIAGNVADQDAVASIEYACGILKTPTLIVMGHQNCGAVHAAMAEDKGKLTDNLKALLSKIEPAVAAVRADNPDLGEDEILDLAIRENVSLVQSQILAQSPLLTQLVDDGSLELKGAVYEMDSGKVEWLK